MDKIKLLEKAKTLPTVSGCYLMKRELSNGLEEVIYVGKAKNLKSRVSSYFNNSAKSPKTEVLVARITDFDFVLTKTDAEAFILENTLIKKHSPKYNIRLRDDKSYPYVVVDHSEPFPRLEYKRRFKRKKELEVFGPFVVGSNISQVLRVIMKSFELRDCNLREFKSRKEPCLLYQIKQCSAPCVDYISDESYRNDLALATNFFKGKGKQSLKYLENKMLEAAEGEHFEQAALIRDNIELLNEFLSFSTHKNVEFKNQSESVDVVAFKQGEMEVDLAIYLVRNGILLGHKNFHFPLSSLDENINEDVLQFLFQYYNNSNDTLPKQVVTGLKSKDNSLLSETLSEALKTNIKFMAPTKKFESLMELAISQSIEHARVRISNQESVFVGLNKLKELLGLKERPVLLECYDVAIFQGSSPTASQIVFHNGKADKAAYRHYALEERAEGNNDFEMMKEVLRRRLKSGNLPDVFIVDGGKGQVSMFAEVLKDFNLDIPVAGIAKSKLKGGTKTEERLIIPGRANPYTLAKNMSLFRIIVQMRDEAHRFSRRLHHKKEKSKLITSWVDEISGIGPKMREHLLKRMNHTREELAEFSLDELENELDVNKKVAKSIYEYLQKLGS